MGYSQYIYFGVYMVVNNQNVPGTVKKYRCSNKKCKKHNGEITSNFCPSCGSAKEENIVPINEELSGFDYLHEKQGDKIYNRLSPVHHAGTDIYDDRTIIIPQDKKWAHISICEEESGDWDMTNKVTSAEREIAKFKSEYQDTLTLLKEGGFTFEIGWGLVISYA